MYVLLRDLRKLLESAGSWSTAGRSGRSAVATWHCSGSALVAEIVAKSCAFDAMVVDLQHGVTDMEQCKSILQAVAGGPIVPLVRCRDSSASHIHQVLDLGALGIIVPMCNSADDAKAIVDASSYPPVQGQVGRLHDTGSRSYGPVRAALAWGVGNYFTQADPLILRWVMIETRAGLDNCEDIALTPGVDGLFIGPNDLSLALGVAPSSAPTSPHVVSAIDRILKAAVDAGKFGGIFCSTGSFAREMQSKGFHFVIAGTDTGYIKRGAAKEFADFVGPSGADGVIEGGGY